MNLPIESCKDFIKRRRQTVPDATIAVLGIEWQFSLFIRWNLLNEPYTAQDLDDIRARVRSFMSPAERHAFQDFVNNVCGDTNKEALTLQKRG